MAKPIKYNYPQLKVDYYQSNQFDIKEFFKQRLGRWDPRFRKHTLGWEEEKMALKNKIAEETLALKVENEIQKYDHALTNLMDWGICDKLKSPEDLDKLSTRDKVEFWKILMTMSGRSTKIEEKLIGNKHDEPFKIINMSLEDVDNLLRHKLSEESRRQQAIQAESSNVG